MARQLATIQKIGEVIPIPDKDRIVLANIEGTGWQVIVQKSEFNTGDYCIYCEIDSQLPNIPEFEFMAKHKFRVKAMKMCGVVSYGLCLPVSMLPDGFKGDVGDDVTELLHITKYEADTDDGLTEDIKPAKLPRSVFFVWMMRFAWFRRIWFSVFKSKKNKNNNGFPSFVSKSDQTRIQNIPNILKSDTLWQSSEKLDGMSCTYSLRKIKKLFKTTYEFKVCSRNFALQQPKLINNSDGQWFLAKKYDIENVLKAIIGDNEWVAIQGECLAPKVQKNKYKVKEPDLYVYDLIYPTGKTDGIKGRDLLSKYGMKWVPILHTDFTMPETVNELLEIANGESVLLEGQKREGLVWRSQSNPNVSFKSVSPEFLLENG